MTTPPQTPPDDRGTAVPAPKPVKPRLLQDGKDMFWSMAPLVVACVALAGLLGMCSFQGSGPGPGPAPSYNAPAALQADAVTLGFPVRLPRLPDGWQPNSGGRDGFDQGRTDPATAQETRAVLSRVGYLSPSGTYLSLTQSNADEDKLVTHLAPEVFPTGATDVDGTKWIVYEGGEGTEPVWTARLKGPTGPAQIAISGAGSTDEFRTLAAATQTQQPLPAKR